MLKVTYFTFIITTILLKFTKAIDKFDENSFASKRNRKPDIVRDLAYCQSCIQIILSSLKELNGKKSETDIDYTLIEIFTNKNKLSRI